ncbi:hypothetical protein B0H14DRAFT_2646844 [Mycena olivaceomarginata]|nr:hypothetical protein B0H14DRAFT_2646844 [Mycena olivaceomarginata]
MALPPLAPVGKYKSTVGVCEAGKARGADTVPTTVGRGGGVGVGVHSAHSTMSAAAWTIPLPTQQTRRVQPPARGRATCYFHWLPLACSRRSPVLASVLQGPARPESPGLGPAWAGLGFHFLRPKPKPWRRAWPGPAWAQAGAWQ